MAILDIRQRTGWLFMAVVVGHILLISTQVSTRRGVPVLEALTFGVFAEVQRAASSGIGSARDVWQNYFALQETRRENEALRTEVAQLRVGLQQERALAEQSRMLQKLLDMKTSTPLETTAATVIAGLGAGIEGRSRLQRAPWPGRNASTPSTLRSPDHSTLAPNDNFDSGITRPSEAKA